VKNTIKALAALFLALTINGCASLSKNTQEQNEAWNNLNQSVSEGELILLTVENKTHDLVLICGHFIVSSPTLVRIRRTNENGIVNTLNFSKNEVRAIEYCLKNTPDRRPLYQNYDP